MNFIKKKKLKEYIKDMSVSKEFGEVLDVKVEKLILDAVQRAKLNGRKTVQGRDL